MKTKIVINVSGGVVQEVFSNDANIDIDLYDFDNMRELPEDVVKEIESEYIKTVENMHFIDF